MDASAEQVSKLVNQYQYLSFLQSILESADDTMNQLACDGIRRILEVGEKNEDGNPYVAVIKETGLIGTLQKLKESDQESELTINAILKFFGMGNDESGEESTWNEKVDQEQEEPMYKHTKGNFHISKIKLN